MACLGLLGNYLLLWSLDVGAFATISLFLAAFQFLQEGMGRSLNWALVRLVPRGERQRPGGGAAMLQAVASVQYRFALAGPLLIVPVAGVVSLAAVTAHAASTASMIVFASLGAAGAVLFQFELGRLQLQERFFAFSGWLVSQSLLRVCAWATLWSLGCLDLFSGIAAHLASTWLLLLLTRNHTGPLPKLQPTAADRAAVLRFGGPMVLATTLAALAAQLDLFLLDATADAGSTARYRLVVLLATVIELATSSVMTALLPRAGRASNPQERRSSLTNNARWGVLVAAFGLCSYPVVLWLIPAWFPPEYASATALWPIVLGGVLATALTDPLGLQFISRDRPHRYVWLNGAMLAIVLVGNLVVPGDDRCLVAAWVRTASRVLLGLGIVCLVWRDLSSPATDPSGPPPPLAP